MASIRRKNDKWQAVIRRAGEAAITRSFLVTYKHRPISADLAIRSAGPLRARNC